MLNHIDADVSPLPSVFILHENRPLPGLFVLPTVLVVTFSKTTTKNHQRTQLEGGWTCLPCTRAGRLTCLIPHEAPILTDSSAFRCF